MAKISPSSAAWYVVSTREREEGGGGGGGEGCMSEREGGGVRVRNGVLVVEGKQIDYCRRDLARWCTIRYRERMLTVCVTTLCVSTV